MEAPRREEGEASSSSSGAASSLDLPYELTLKIVEYCDAQHRRGKTQQKPGSTAGRFDALKTLRLVNKQFNQLATDLLVKDYVAALETQLQHLTAVLSSKWEEGQPNERQASMLAACFEALSKAGEELKFLQRKLQEKMEARRAIYRMPNVDDGTRMQLLKACYFDAELLGLRNVAESLHKEKEQLEPSKRRREEDWRGGPLRVDDPYRHRRPPPFPRGPGFPAPPPIFGEPDPDHMEPPDWERDRNPAPFPAGPMGPSSPFGYDPTAPGPFNPRPPGPGGGMGPRWI
ncbi:Proteasome inhibitor PI31 subunit [Balamuthia mandrillaris]